MSIIPLVSERVLAAGEYDLTPNLFEFMKVRGDHYLALSSCFETGLSGNTYGGYLHKFFFDMLGVGMNVLSDLDNVS